MKYTLKQGLRWCMLSMAVSASAQVSAPVASTQLPTGGKVMSGTTSIQSVGNVLNINQSSQRSAINWNTFNVGSGAKVNFIQPSASSVTLNRVLDTNGSQILGNISANGQVFISNPNGVLFGPNSQVNVGGLIATTQNISVDDFMAGKSTFEGSGSAGSVVNQGTLEAALGGYIALLAPSVRNEGVVLAREGTIAIAAGDRTVVQFNGPQLVTVMVDKPVLDALVENKQMVRADGGLVIFSARSANAVLSSVIKNTGTVQANTIVNRQGRIMLEGGSQGVVEVGGTLQASGVDASTQGGTISVTGDKVSVVTGALLDATGQSGGGNVLVGGGWQGSDPTIQSANAVNIASGAVLNASAIQNGKGGTVVAWSDTQNSDGMTKVQGTLLARGGAEGGDGGRIETSGRWISTSGAKGDASAASGNGGQWLFDPYDVDIIETPGTTNQVSNTANTWSPIGNSSTILNSDITSLLNAGTNVTILVPTSGGGGLSGDIKISAPIVQQAASPSANLTLSAYRNLLIDQPITLTGNTGTLQLTAGTGSSALGYISIDNAITANTISIDNFAIGPVTQTVALSANNLRISAPLSDVTLNNASNQIGALAASVKSLNLHTNQGIDSGSSYGSGMAIGVVGNLTGVTATNDVSVSVLSGNLFVDKSITTASTSSTALKLNAGSSLSTGPYSGTNSVNNPYGPNIILASDFSTTNQSISVGSGGKGLLYTGGYGNSGALLATYLGSNKSRYNSNESTTNFSTATGSGLTAIYRQNPSMIVTGPSASTTYGTAPTFGTNSISGLANSDTSAGMTLGTYSYTSSLSTSGNQKAGSYSVIPTGASNGLGYGITYSNGTLSVAQKALTYVSGIVANNKTYDGDTVATIDTSSVVISGNINNDVITGGSAQGTFANKNAGIGKIVTLSNPVLYGTDAANYSINLSQLTTTATINQAPAVVTAGSLSTTYSGTTQFILGSNFTATGLVGGETKSVLTGVSASGSGINAGTYATTASGTDTNYSLTFVPGSLVINPAPLTVTANNRSKTYGDTMTFAGTEFTTSGLQNGQTATSASFTTSGAAATAANSGSPYTITPSALTGGTFNSSNYAITYANGLLTVNKAPLTITANSFTKTYGDTITLIGNEFSTSGLKNSETTSTATLTTTGAVATAPYSSTPYSVTPSAVLGANGFNTSNYTITYVNGGINVSKAPLSVTANSYTKTYGDLMTFSGTEFSTSGLKNSETATSATITSSGAPENASYSGGAYAITPTALTGGTFSTNNYSITYNAGSLTVNKAPLTVTANSYTKIYGDTLSFTGSEFSTSGLKNNETATTVTLTTLGGISTAAHSSTPYTITPSTLSGGTFSTNNYNINYVNGGLTVSKAPLSVTANSFVKTYGDSLTLNGTEFSTSGLKNNETATSATLTTAGAVTNAPVIGSPYLITPSLLTGGTFNSNNYIISYAAGSLTVNQAPLTISANNRTKTYGDAVTFAGSEFSSVGLKNNETLGSATISSSGSSPTAVYSASPYSIAISSITGGSVNPINSNNYAISYINGGLTVNKANLTVTANSYSKTYGDSIPFTGSEFTTSGLKNNETVATATLTSSGSPSTAPYSVSPYAITASALSGGTFSTNNYNISYVDGGLTVNKANLTVTSNSFVKTYGDLVTFSGTEFSTSGLKNNETATSATLSSSGASKNAAYSSSLYSVMTSGLAGGTFSPNNYNITYVNGGLRVNKANATVIGLSGSTEFDGTTKTLTGFTATGLVNNETTGDIAKSANNPNGISASTSGRFSGTYLNTPYGTANNYNLNFVSGQLVITGCPGGPPCTAIGPQTTASNITPVVMPATTTASFASAVLSTTSPTISAAPVVAFASSSGVGSFGSGGGPSTLANGNAPTNSVNTVNVISSGNTTTNSSPASSTTTTTIVNAGANPTNPANPTTNVLNIATTTPAGSPTIAQNSPSPVPTSAAPSNTTTASASPTPTSTVNTVNTANTLNAPNNVTAQATVPTNQLPTNNTAGTPNTNVVITQPATGVVGAVANNPTPTPLNTTVTQPNAVNPQRLADILSKKDPVEIATALPPTQVAQLSPEQVAPLVNSLNLRQLMSLTNDQISKLDPARQTELLNIIKVIKDNPEKAAEKAFTPTDKTFAQLAANGLLKEQLDTLSTRVTQINQNRTTVNIDTPQKLAELLNKKDPIEIATALPSNQVAQLTPEQAAPLINSLTVRQLMALTNEQISKLDPARQAELLNIINVIKNNPEKAADKAYTAIDKTTAQYVANGLMKEQIDALALRVSQFTQSKTNTNIDTPQKLAEILNKNNPVEIASSIPSNIVPQLSSDQVAPLINALSVKQLLSLTNEQMSKLDPTRLAELINILKGLKDNPEKATDKTYTPEDAAVAKYAATGLLKDPIERLSLRANYIAENKFKDPLGKELADLTNPPVPTNVPVARNAPNQANRPLNAAQLTAQNANRETPNLTPAQVAALDPKDLGPLLSQLNANQLLAVTNTQMAGLENAYLNQLTVLLNFVQNRVTSPIANAGPATPGNRVNNTNIFINQPIAKLAGAALLADQPNVAPLTPPIPAPTATLASVSLTPKQVSELDPAQLAPLINQLNANQLMAITDAQMARMDGRALNQLTILMNFVQQRTASNNAPANGNNPASGGNTANINVFVNQPVSRLASNALLNEQPKSNELVGNQSFAQTNITVNLTPRQVSELDPTQLSPLISQLNANQLMAITNTQMARLDTQSINQLNILMNFVQQRALNSNTTTTIYINQPVSRIAAASLMNDQPPPPQLAGAAPAPVATVPLSPQQIANLTPNQVAPLLNRMNSRQLMAVTDTQMASLDSANLNQLITLLNFIQDSARTSPIVTNNFATRPVASFLPPELNTTQTVTQP